MEFKRPPDIYPLTCEQVSGFQKGLGNQLQPIPCFMMVVIILHMRSLPYGQFLSLRKINSEYRGYDDMVISRAFTKAIYQDRNKVLYGKLRNKIETRCIFSFEFSPVSA